MFELLITVAVGLLTVAGIIGGLTALRELPRLRRRLALLESQLNRQSAANVPTPEFSAETPAELAEDHSAHSTADPSFDRWEEEDEPRAAYVDHLAQLIRNNWMSWLGGLCVALAGIFLAVYSIEKGLLGPAARVVLGIAVGIALHAGAEYLRRRQRQSHPALAALAGGGSVTLFAALLAALHLYELISTPFAFLCLAIVAMVTMWMAYVHGPVLAAFGIVGAYLVPIAVASGEGRILVALAYSLIVTTSALLLLRYVHRSWLWWGFIAGALGWWAISLLTEGADGLRGLYLATIAYLILAVPGFDWRLRERQSLASAAYQIRNWLPRDGSARQTFASIVLLILAQGVSITVQADYSDALMQYSPLLVLLLFASRFREPLNVTPWLALIVMAIAWLLPQLSVQGEAISLRLLVAPHDSQALWYFGVSAAILSGFALANMLACRFKALWASLVALAPVLSLALAYVLTARLLSSWQWGFVTMLFALSYLAIASTSVHRKTLDSLVIWLYVGGHFAVSLAAVMVLHEATLTLAIAVQLISVAWIMRRFELPSLGWLLKLLVAIVVTRLTFNPWLAGYAADTHWSLWTFGGSTVCAMLAMKMLAPYAKLRKWTEGAALHLVVLTLWSEVRYWLHDGAVFADEFSALEAGIYVLLFGSLSIVYHRRSLVGEHLQPVYSAYSYVLAALALGSYAMLIAATLASSRWIEVGSTPLFNMMLLYFGVPVCLAFAFFRYHHQRYRLAAAIVTAVAAFVFFSLEIRHLWQSTIRLDLPTGSGELYTYSLVWLTMAVITMLAGVWKFGKRCYRAGMLLLALVVAKIFLVDMSDLDGLLRVASFMGLGLALLGLAYLHQRFQPQAPRDGLRESP